MWSLGLTGVSALTPNGCRPLFLGITQPPQCLLVAEGGGCVCGRWPIIGPIQPHDPRLGQSAAPPQEFESQTVDKTMANAKNIVMPQITK